MWGCEWVNFDFINPYLASDILLTKTAVNTLKKWLREMTEFLSHLVPDHCLIFLSIGSNRCWQQKLFLLLLLHSLNRNTSWLSSSKLNVWILTCTQATQVLSLKLYLKKTYKDLSLFPNIVLVLIILCTPLVLSLSIAPLRMAYCVQFCAIAEPEYFQSSAASLMVLIYKQGSSTGLCIAKHRWK